MILSGRRLEEAVRQCVDPAPADVDPVSVDLHVDDAFVLEPGDYHVARTTEALDMRRDLAALVTGRSAHMRRGIYMPGGFVDPGYGSGPDAPFVLEFFNMSDEARVVGDGEAGARLTFIELSDEVTGYDGRWGADP